MKLLFKRANRKNSSGAASMGYCFLVQLLKRIEVGERTIENLQQEVTLLQRSDALERARQQHDDVIARMNEQHESHLLEVTTMLDQVRRVADEKVITPSSFFEIPSLF